MSYLEEGNDFRIGQKVFAARLNTCTCSNCSRCTDTRKMYEIATIISIKYGDGSGSNQIQDRRVSYVHQNTKQNYDQIYAEYQHHMRNDEKEMQINGQAEKRYDIMFQRDKQHLLNVPHSAMKNSHQCIFWRLLRPEFVKHRGKSLIEKYLSLEERAEVGDIMSTNIGILSNKVNKCDQCKVADNDDLTRQRIDVPYNYSGSGPNSTYGPFEHVPHYSSGDLLLPSAPAITCPCCLPYACTSLDAAELTQPTQFTTLRKRDSDNSSGDACSNGMRNSNIDSSNGHCKTIGNTCTRPCDRKSNYNPSYSTADQLFDYQHAYTPSAISSISVLPISSPSSSSSPASKYMNSAADNKCNRASNIHDSQSSDSNQADDYLNYESFQRNCGVNSDDNSNILTTIDNSPVRNSTESNTNVNAILVDSKSHISQEYLPSYSFAEQLFDYQSTYAPSSSLLSLYSSVPPISSSSAPSISSESSLLVNNNVTAGTIHAMCAEFLPSSCGSSSSNDRRMNVKPMNIGCGTGKQNLATSLFLTNQNKSSRSNSKRNRARSRSEDLSRGLGRSTAKAEVARIASVMAISSLESTEYSEFEGKSLFRSNEITTSLERLSINRCDMIESEITIGRSILDVKGTLCSHNQNDAFQPSTTSCTSKNTVSNTVGPISSSADLSTTINDVEIKMPQPVVTRRRSGSAGFFNSIMQCPSYPLGRIADERSKKKKSPLSPSSATITVSNTTTCQSMPLDLTNLSSHSSLSTHLPAFTSQYIAPITSSAPSLGPIPAVVRAMVSKTPPLSADSLSAFSRKKSCNLTRDAHSTHSRQPP